MNVAELERLLDGMEERGAFGCLKELQSMAPSLDRRVIAAERMAEAIRRVSFSDNGIELICSLSAYEATK